LIALDRCQPEPSKRFIWEDGEFDVVQILRDA
jgi:hypothetical protein